MLFRVSLNIATIQMLYHFQIQVGWASACLESLTSASEGMRECVCARPWQELVRTDEMVLKGIIGPFQLLRLQHEFWIMPSCTPGFWSWVFLNL